MQGWRAQDPGEEVGVGRKERDRQRDRDIVRECEKESFKSLAVSEMGKGKWERKENLDKMQVLRNCPDSPGNAKKRERTRRDMSDQQQDGSRSASCLQPIFLHSLLP